MTKRIAIIQGHPDPVGNHFLHALAAAYAEGAQAQGHAVRTLDVAQMAFPLLRTREEYEQGPPPEAIVKAQETIAWAGHLVVFYPLWLGTMPALLKGFLEQVLRPGFAYPPPQDAGMMKGLLKGRSARIVVTMGMPALIYRWYFGAHSLKSLERNVLKLCGVGPVRETLIGMVEAGDDAKRKAWLGKIRALGQSGV